jgi:hypothetical protein
LSWRTAGRGALFDDDLYQRHGRGHAA